MSVVYSENLQLPVFNKSEIIRYCGAKSSNLQLDALIDECIAEASDKIKGLVCFCEFDISIKENEVDLGFAKLNSSLLQKHLKNCEKIILFAATIGLDIDRLISRYSRISPGKALIFQAIGAERIEALCDVFEDKIKQNNKKTVPRVSAGYGDIPLMLQKDIFATLSCSKNIALTLNDSMMMSPSKSVTAIIGIGENYEY